MGKRLAIAALVVGAVYAVIAIAQAEAAEEVAPVAIEESVEKESPSNFFQRWVAQKVAETDERLAERVQAVEDREAAVKEAEAAMKTQLTEVSVVRQQVVMAASDLSTCSSTALKEVSRVAEAP